MSKVEGFILLCFGNQHVIYKLYRVFRMEEIVTLRNISKTLVHVVVDIHNL